MPPEIVEQIIAILNNSSIPMQDKQSELNALKGRCNDNGQTIQIVVDFLSEYALPLSADGEIEVYSASNATDEVYTILAEVLLHSTCTYFKAVCGEFLSVHLHRRELAEIALWAYFDELRAPSFDTDTFFACMVGGICRVYSRYPSCSFEFEEFFRISINYVKEHLNDDGYLPLFILNGLWHCNVHRVAIESIFYEAITEFRRSGNYDRATAFRQDLISHYLKQQNDVKDLREAQANDYEAHADQLDWNIPSDAYMIRNHILRAMNELQKINSPKRKRLARRLEQIRPKLLDSLKTFKSNLVDISDIATQIGARIGTLTFMEVIFELSHLMPLYGQIEIKDILRHEKCSFSSIFPRIILDHSGRTRCIVPSITSTESKDIEAVMEHRAREEYSIRAEIMLQNYLRIAREKFSFDRDNLRFLVESNVFIPTDRRDSYLLGLLAGFNSDYVTAMHILMPQIENAIRVLAEECGALVYKTNENGMQECFPLNKILDMQELKDCLDETLIFNLRVFFTSNYGFGMRNIIGHGLDSDNLLQSADGLAVWGFVLRLCCDYCPEFFF